MEFWHTLVDQALNTSFLEIIAVVFGVSSVWFSKKENILVYPTGIVSVLIYTYLCFIIGLYADVAIQIFYFGMSIYGWINWSKKDIKLNELPISQLSVLNLVYAFFSMGLLWLIFWFVLNNLTDSTVPIIDACTTAICFVGMWLMAWKKIENWIFWIVANLISIPLYWHKGLPLTSVQFILLTVLAVAGFIEWRKKIKKI